ACHATISTTATPRSASSVTTRAGSVVRVASPIRHRCSRAHGLGGPALTPLGPSATEAVPSAGPSSSVAEVSVAEVIREARRVQVDLYLHRPRQSGTGRADRELSRGPPRAREDLHVRRRR